MNTFLREPLVQFLLLGTLLFAVFEFVGQFNLEKRRQIVVTPEQIDALNKGFAIDFGKPPTPADTEKLIQDHLREEVLVQEAIKLGYHTSDQKIRIELRQRMEEAYSLVPVPTDQELEQFYQQYPDRFRGATDHPALSFDQIKPTVRSVWQATKRKEAGDAAFQRFLQNYIVVVQRPKAPATAPTTGVAP